MEQRDLAGTGLKSSRVVLGAWVFGSQAAEPEAREMIELALAAGVNHFDTAVSYGEGASEEILGRALRSRRSDVIIATKALGRFAEGPDGAGLSGRAIIGAIETSLRRLGTDYVDLYYLHSPDRSVPIEETLAAMADLVAQGKVRQLGFLNYAAWQVAALLHSSEVHRWPAVRIGQQLYNPISRGLEEEYAEFATAHQVAILVYNPLAGGLLTGKHRGAREPSVGRFLDSAVYRDRYWSPAQMAAAERFAVIAETCSRSPVELALSWLLARPVVDAVILGASNPQQLKANLAAAKLPPPEPATLHAVDALWREVRGIFPRYNR